MPFTTITPEQAAELTASRGEAASEYIDNMRDLEPGTIVRIRPGDEGVQKQTVKNRLNRAAKALGVEVDYMRSPADEVLFTINGHPSA